MDLLVLAVWDVGPQSPDVDSRGAHSGDRSSASLPAPSPWPEVAERAPFSGEIHLSRWMQWIHGHQHSMVRQRQSGLAHCPLPVALKVPRHLGRFQEDFRKAADLAGSRHRCTWEPDSGHWTCCSSLRWAVSVVTSQTPWTLQLEAVKS